MDEINLIRAKYPRVSSIIGKQNESEMRAIPVETLANACIRGTKVHGYCAALAKGMFLPEIEPEYEPYVDAFSDWMTRNMIAPLSANVRLYDDVKRFTGEYDMVLQLKSGKKALVDIKTSSAISKAWPIQLAAYDHLCKLNNIEYDEVFILHLRKKAASKDEASPYKVCATTYSYENLSTYWEVFSSALNCYNYFHRKEKE